VLFTHDATAFGRVGHTVQAAPHAAGSVSDLHVLPAQAWNFVLQVEAHVPSLQATVPFAGFEQSFTVRQPSLHLRDDSSQKRPLLHSSSLVQPALQEFEARSQYDSTGHGHVAGRSTHFPSEQT